MVRPGVPDLLREVSVRFSAPVYPGETLLTEISQDDDDIGFRCRVPERDVVVLSNGRVRLREA